MSTIVTDRRKIPQSNRRIVSSATSFSIHASATVATVGSLVLIGWAFDIATLKSVSPGLATMKANTALAFVLASLSLWLYQKEQGPRRPVGIAQACALTVALIGLLTLSEHIFAWDLGIDQLLFKEPARAIQSGAPGRMAPATAFNFLLLGSALMLLPTRYGPWPAQFLCVATLLVSLLAVLGYAYSVSSLYALAPYASMALHAALTFAVLSIAIMSAQPDRGLFAVVTSDRAGGIMARRLLPAVILLPPVLAWARLMGERAGIYGLEFGLALFALSNVILLSVLVWWNADLLNRTDAERTQAEDHTRRTLERIQALYEIDLAITSTLDLRTVLRMLLEKIDPSFPASASTVRLVNKDSGLLEPIACRNIDEEEWKERLPSGPGHAVAVLARTTPLQVRNIQTAPETRDPGFFRKHGFVSFLGVPLVAKGEPLGVLSLYTKEEHEFSSDEVEFLSTLGGQAAIAIHNSQLYGQAQKSLEHIRALREVDRAITSTLDLQAVLDLLLEEIDLLLPYSAATVRLWNAETGKLEPVACRNIDLQGWQTAGPRGVGLPRAVFETKAPVVIQNVQTDPRASARDFLRSQGLVSYLGIPLIVKDAVLGVLGFYTKEEHEFSSDEIEFLTTVARQAAIAIHNSQMYQEMSNLAADLSRSNKVKGEFLSVMSHELRTPLNVVMGYTALLKERMLGDINPKQEDALTKITGRANDQLAMINNILYATVLEAQNLKPEHQPVVLGDLLKQIRSTCEAVLDRPLALKWDCNDPLLVVHTDGGKLRQALQNLLDNAIKFTEKGDITVSARHDREQKLVEFKVSDTGIGIPKHFLPFIFDKFHQVDSSETRLYGGVGLGLYITGRLVEVLGGKVSADSEVGKGSTFTVTIPYRADAGS